MNKKTIILAVSIIFAGMLVSCGSKGSGGMLSIGNRNKITYKYDNSKVMDEVKITKSVYSDGELEVYILDLGDKFSLAYYDMDFQLLNMDFDYEYKKGKLTIRGEGAERISGLNIKSSSYREIKLRYLDSNQYAILVDYFVDDLGTETYGDLDAYYTKEERAAEQTAKDARLKQQEENYKAVEGYWESVEGNGEYVYIFTNEKGEKWLRQALLYNDELNVEDTFINTINISEIGIVDYYAYYELEILDSDGWGCRYQFDLNEDMTAIMDWNTKAERFVRKQPAFS